MSRQKLRIFISYAREDYEHAKRLFSEFSRQPKLNPWLDVESLLPGARWEDEILDQIGNSEYIVILLSGHSVSKSGFVQKEIREAIEQLMCLPPQGRMIIPVRLESCTPSHRELRKLNYVDLFPDWNVGIKRLITSFGVKSYTHNFIALGATKKGGCRLAPLGTTYGAPPEQVVPVSLDDIPEIVVRHIPSEGLDRNGVSKNTLVGLWSTASSALISTYRKSDWMKLDEALFKQRRNKKDKETIARIIRRQWALAKELENYKELPWQSLYHLIQQQYN